ncbi:MAG TPA: hypothetical protein VFT22_38175 [Kofleriaceae bacterium]|nr:hypothetical protein [Kofleriaceae bacterium]
MAAAAQPGLAAGALDRDVAIPDRRPEHLEQRTGMDAAHVLESSFVGWRHGKRSHDVMA